MKFSNAYLYQNNYNFKNSNSMNAGYVHVSLYPLITKFIEIQLLSTERESFFLKKTFYFSI